MPLRGRDARTGVDHARGDAATVALTPGGLERDPNLPLVRVLDRVRDQVAEDLTHPRRIALYDRHLRGQVEREAEPLPLGGGPMLLADVADQRRQVDGGALDLDQRRLGAGQ